MSVAWLCENDGHMFAGGGICKVCQYRLRCNDCRIILREDNMEFHIENECRSVFGKRTGRYYPEYKLNIVRGDNGSVIDGDSNLVLYGSMNVVTGNKNFLLWCEGLWVTGDGETWIRNERRG